jgi:hypothetical protein
MKRWRDIGTEMFEPALDGRTEERMIRGLLEPHEAPVGFAGVAAVLRSAALASGGDAAAVEYDRALRQRIVASMVSIISSAPSDLSVVVPPPNLRAGRRRGPVPFRPRLRLVGVAVVGFLLASVGLAFAGALPGPAQSVASSLLSHVGIHVPAEHGSHSATHAGSAGEPAQRPGTPTGHAPAAKGGGKGPATPGPGRHGDHGRGRGRDHRSGDHGRDSRGDHHHGDHRDHGSDGNGRSGRGGDNGHQDHGRDHRGGTGHYGGGRDSGNRHGSSGGHTQHGHGSRRHG